MGVTAARAQAPPAPPCPGDPPVLRVTRAGADRPVLSWDRRCEMAIERSGDPAFPAPATERLADPAVAPVSRPFTDASPPAGLAFYRLDAFDPEWPFWEACRGGAGSAPRSVSVRNDNDAASGFGFGFSAGDIEAAQFFAPAPMRLERVQFFFWGTPGPVEIRAYADLGGSWPDESRQLGPPILLPTVTTGAWMSVDVSSWNVAIHPNVPIWIGYVHRQEEPFLVIDSGGGTSHSKFKDPDTVPEPWRWATWAGEAEYLMRIEGQSFCEPPTRFFADRSVESGLAAHDEAWIAWGDFDRDRRDDLLLSGRRLLRNDGTGRFVDLTDGLGLSPDSDDATFGLFLDFDNDRDQDIFLARWTAIDVDGDGNPPAPQPGDPTDRVFSNNGLGFFTRVDPCGLEAPDPTATAATGDLDGDGFVDLFIGNWLDEWPWARSSLDRVFLGNGDGTFRDATAALGLGDQGPGATPTYAASIADFDGDGDADIRAGTYAHVPNMLWENQRAQGGTGFVEVAAAVGLAQDAQPDGGLTYGSDWGDFDNDGDLDLFQAEIAHPRALDFADTSALMVNPGGLSPVFTDETRARGIRYEEGGIEANWVDFDNDGDLDLSISHVYPLQFFRLYRQDDGFFTDVTWEAGLLVSEALGHAWADHDRDGDLDLVLSSQGPGGHVWLFENLVGSANAWATFRLEGESCGRRPGCNCSAIGARVRVTSGGVTRLREVQGAKGHFVSQNSLPVEFGLGQATSMDAVEVLWPCGRLETFTGAQPGRFHLLREGTGSVVME